MWLIDELLNSWKSACFMKMIISINWWLWKLAASSILRAPGRVHWRLRQLVWRPAKIKSTVLCTVFIPWFCQWVTRREYKFHPTNMYRVPNLCWELVTRVCFFLINEWNLYADGNNLNTVNREIMGVVFPGLIRRSLFAETKAASNLGDWSCSLIIPVCWALHAVTPQTTLLMMYQKIGGQWVLTGYLKHRIFT